MIHNMSLLLRNAPNNIQTIVVRHLCSVLAKEKQCVGNGQHVGKSEESPENWDKARPFNEIPGPKPAPILGNLWRFIPGIGTYGGLQLHDISIKYNQDYGDIMMLRDIKIRGDVLFVFNSKDTETVYRYEGPSPLRDILHSIKYYRLTLRNDVFQNFGGVFTADGEEWIEARSKINPILMQPRTVKMYNEPMDIIAHEFIEKVGYLSKLHPQGELPKDFFMEINKWSMESVAYMALNKRLGLLDINLDPNSEKQQFVNNTLAFFDMLYAIDIKPNLSKYISTPLWKKYIKLLDNLTYYVKNEFDTCAREFNKTVDKPSHKMSILEKLLKNNEKLAFGTIFDMMLGGIDTTSRSIGGFLYYMAKHQQPQRILLEELRRVLPQRDEPINQEKLEQMPYLRACLKESMRLAPIAVGTSRKTVKDLVLSGYRVPKGTDVVMSLFAMSRNDKYFERPTEFIPERWLRENGAKEKIDPWVFLPFGFGPRTCVGKRLATMEMETLTAKFMRNFHIEWPHPDMRFKMTVLYGIADPLRLRVKPVQD